MMEVERTVIASGRTLDRRWWQIGPGRIELFLSDAGWASRVWGFGATDLFLDVDGVFENESEGVRWCERMAAILARDLDDAQMVDEENANPE